MLMKKKKLYYIDEMKPKNQFLYAIIYRAGLVT